MLATWLAGSLLDLDLGSTPLYVTGVVILLYNTLLWAMLGRLQAGSDQSLVGYSRLAHLQVGLDWLAMTALIHFSGGVESPIIFFFTFHIIIASLLFSQRTAAIYAFTALFLVGGMVVLELAGWLPHVHVEGFMAADSYQSPAFLIGVLGAFAAISIVVVYLTSSIAERLRKREEQLSTLYLGAQTVNSSLELHDVLERLVQATAEAMAVSAASIGLLDHTGTRVEVSAAFGLSDAYLHKGPILLEDNPIHAKVLSSGRPAIIQGEADRAKLQYPDAMKTENIRSILYVRLQVRNRALGVVPKLFAAGVAVLLAAPWTIRRLTQFTELLLGGIGEVGQ